jgi:hypothetical protein
MMGIIARCVGHHWGGLWASLPVVWGIIGVDDGQHWLWCGAILGDLKGKRKGRLGKRCVDGACGGWGESLWWRS